MLSLFPGFHYGRRTEMKTENVNKFKNQIEIACDKKVNMIENDFFRYAVRSILAGAFLTLAGLAGFAIGDLMTSWPNLSKIAFALVFSFGLLFILFLGGELATSNMMYLTAGRYYKRLSTGQMLKILLTCTIFNLIGAVIVAYLTKLSGLLGGFDVNNLAVKIAETKLNSSPGGVVGGAIIANIFVNIAILSWLLIDSQSAKLGIIQSAIFMFVVLGFDHLVANFGTFSIVKLSGLNIPGLSLSNVFGKLGLVFIGNYIGGGLLIGLTYAWLNKPKS